MTIGLLQLDIRRIRFIGENDDPMVPAFPSLHAEVLGLDPVFMP
jgi:hypothetical protein